MTTPYRRGHALELRVKKRLESKGWYVIRAAGSKGLSDLVAVRDGLLLKREHVWPAHRLVFLQCKRDGKIPPRELHDFQQLIKRIHSAEGYVVRGGRMMEVREVLFWERNAWAPIEESL